MARYNPVHFNINHPVFVRKAFAGNGRMWLPGQLFDWKHFAIAPSRVRALFRASYLRHETEEEMRDECDFELTVEELVEEETETEEVATFTPPSLEPEYTIRHRGGPYWDVVDSEGNVKNEKAIRRKEAEALFAELDKGQTTDENTDLPFGVTE